MFEMKTMVPVLGSFLAVAALAAASGGCAAPVESGAEPAPAAEEAEQNGVTKRLSGEGPSIVEQAKGPMTDRIVRDGAQVKIDVLGDDLELADHQR
jgi:hypothetical protein